MKKTFLYAAWCVLFLLCTVLGFVEEPSGWVRVLLTALSVLFFLPPALLVRSAKKEKDAATVALLGKLSVLSLGLTALLLVGNILSALGSETLGIFLHVLLTVVSCPMICSGYWFISLFLWACLAIVCRGLRKTIR